MTRRFGRNQVFHFWFEALAKVVPFPDWDDIFELRFFESFISFSRFLHFCENCRLALKAKNFAKTAKFFASLNSWKKVRILGLGLLSGRRYPPSLSVSFFYGRSSSESCSCMWSRHRNKPKRATVACVWK